ncbi:MAG: DUF3857 domain-containing protein [Mucilaginibacter sp.]
MNKFFALCLISAFATSISAQTPVPQIPKTEEYGKVSQADLDLKTCDFEKDANAMVLFDKGNMSLDGGALTMTRHVRMKIFSETGTGYGSIRLSYGTTILPSLNDIEGETINQENGKVVITALDKKDIFTEKTDKYHSTLAFALPRVKAGSIIEFKYKWRTGYSNWYFQSKLPTRYSEITTELPKITSGVRVRVIPHVKQPYVIDIGTTDDIKQVKALANIPSLPDEPYMSAREDNLQRMEFVAIYTLFDTWNKLGGILMKISLFGDQFDQILSGDGPIIKEAKALKTQDEKIAYIFDAVKNSMKWDENLMFYSLNGISAAWDKKTGNSAEINMILYRLLKKAGIKAFPLVISTKKNGKLYPFNPNPDVLNSMMVYIPIDSTKNYVLDATSKFNLYNTKPVDVLNTFCLCVDPTYLGEGSKTVYIENTDPVLQSVFINAEIKPTGKMSGSTQISSSAYNKINAVKRYKTDGEEKYIDFLRNKDNNIKISALKLDNMDVDSLSLAQTFNFEAELTGSDQNYIYFNTNLFLEMGVNPFIKDTRFSDIDFGYLDNYSVNGVYKLPAGFVVGSLPKPVNVVMPDGSIVFRRVVAENEGTITVRYVLLHKKTLLYSDSYDALHDFYKQMYELLNEPIVLKKS